MSAKSKRAGAMAANGNDFGRRATAGAPPLRVVKGAGKREQLLPCNPEAERNFLGSILINPDRADLCELLAPQDFYLAAHARVFEAMQALHSAGTPVDLALVDDWLSGHGALGEIGGAAFVSNLATHVVTSRHVAHYARIILKKSLERRAIAIAADLAAKSYAADGEIEAIVSKAQASLNGLLDRSAQAAVSKEDVFSAADLMAMELPEPRYIIERVLPAGLVMLAAKQKIGKSFFALALCLAVASGGFALGTPERVEQGDVLYLALEDTPKRLQNRIAQMQRSREAPARLTLATRWPRLDRGGLRRIEQWLREHPDRRLVVIDVLQKVRAPRAKHGDVYEEDYATMAPLKDLAERYDLAVLVIHHTSKAAHSDVFDEIRDSAGLTAACDAVMVLRRARGERSATLHVTGRDVDEQELALSMDRETGLWTLDGEAHGPEQSQARREIITAIVQAGRPLYPSQVAEATGKNRSTTRTLLSRMAAAGEVIMGYNGKYSVDTVDSVDSDRAKPHEKDD